MKHYPATVFPTLVMLTVMSGAMIISLDQTSAAPTVPPSSPTDLSITGGANGTYAGLVWNPVPEATNYQVWLDAAPYFVPEGDPLATVSAPVYLDTQTDPDLPVNHFYGVTATDASGNTSALSSRVGVFHFALTVPNDEPPPTSYELIDQALADGEINAETGLVYKVYADFGDDRLPVRFRGDDSSVVDSHIISEVQAQWENLSPDSRSILGPFLIPPAYEGSWWDLQNSSNQGAQVPSTEFAAASNYQDPPPCPDEWPQWEFKDSSQANVPVRVWWPKSQPSYLQQANAVLGAIETAIWPKLVDLMQQAPMPDNDAQCNGRSGHLDIYLVDTVALGQTIPLTPPGCKATPTFIELNPWASSSTIAHELMHSIQARYDTWSPGGCVFGSEYKWLAEATAKWAEDYVYPLVNEEHVAAMDFLAAPDKSLESYSYGAYLYPFYLARESDGQFGDTDVVRRIWEFAQLRMSLDAVHSAASQGPKGGFSATWPEFAGHNWNQFPLNHYREWDKLYYVADAEKDKTISLQRAPFASEPISPSDINHLAARYFRYLFTDDNVRNAIFRNGLSWKLDQTADSSDYTYDGVDARGLHIKALVKIAGQAWDIRDWTNETETYFCRDVSTERLEELVLIFSNSEWLDRTWTLTPQGLPPQLSVSNLGCAGWEGQVDYTNTVSGEGYSYTTQSTADVTWLLDLGQTSGDNRFYHPEGNLHWSVSGTDGFGCQLQGSGDIPIETYMGSLWTDNGLIGGPDRRKYHAGGFWVYDAQVTKTCPDGVATVDWHWKWLPEGVAGTIQSDGVTIDDSLHEGDGDPGGPRDWTWHFTATSDP